jgi:hypothetical protein
MKRILITGWLSILICCQSFTQEAWQTHTRGLLHQSVFNTGALGVQYNSFRVNYSGDSMRTPFEWPGNSYFRSENKEYWYYNACGGGLGMLCDTGRTGNRADYLILDTVVSATTRGVDMIGCLALGGAGTYRDGTGIHYWPGIVSKRNNFPLNSDGTWNNSYDPTEAEEIITSSVKTPYGITITRVSRAWSYPGYDGFIIYDYKFENTGDYFKGIPNNTPDTLSEIAVSWIESLLPSYAYMNMQKGDFTTGASNELSHFDLKRYMQYVHSPDGRPHSTNYADWSANGTNGGGLMAPAAVGYMMLYFDYDHLMPIATSRFASAIKTAINEQSYVYDPNGKFKQPWVVATTQANLSTTKILSHVNGTAGSRYNTWSPNNPAVGDGLIRQWLSPQDSTYWWGRARPNNNYNYASPMVRSYVLGPYMLPPNQSFHVVVAELAGFGPGRKGDAIYRDYGGGTETSIGDATDNNFHPVASWDSVITYTNAPIAISSTGGVGINYIPQYGIPHYIRDTTVVSIRDVADRCIQLYSGNTSVIKYDTSQYEPWGNTSASRYAPSPSGIAARTGGWNAGMKIPLPAPIFIAAPAKTTGKNISNNLATYAPTQLSWIATIDSIPTLIRSYIKSGLNYYQILRSTSQLGPWTILDSVGRIDPRYYDTFSQYYIYFDWSSIVGSTYYYAVVAVDSLGGKSGLTNIQKYVCILDGIQNGNTNQPYVYQLNQNYPNPFNPSTQITYTIAKRGTVSLVVYDLLGREVSKLVNEVKDVGSYMATLNSARLSSGVYFYRLKSGSFVQTKKMLMMK